MEYGETTANGFHFTFEIDTMRLFMEKYRHVAKVSIHDPLNRATSGHLAVEFYGRTANDARDKATAACREWAAAQATS